MSSSSSSQSIPTEDRVSSLPDAILSHILSFLPIKSCVATTILSKSWQTLWLSLFDLNFHDAQTFKDFNVTFLPPPSRKGYDDDLKNKNNEIIIDAELQRGTETLHMVVYRSKDHVLKLTRTIFTCRKLSFLKLNNLSLNFNDLPPLVNLPLLQTLQLENVCFNPETYIFKFLLGCPIIQELKIDDDCLARFVVNDHLPISFSLLSQLQILSVKSIRHIYIQVPTFHNLTQMEIFFSNFKGRSWRDKWNWVLEMLQHTPKLQDLTIHEEMEDGICQDNWHDPQVVPECLSTQLKTCSVIEYRGKKSEFRFLYYIMRNLIQFRTLIVQPAKSLSLYEKYPMIKEVFTIRRTPVCILFDENV